MDKFRLKYLLLSDYVVEYKDGKIGVLGIFDKISAPNFPMTHSMSFLVGNFEVLDPTLEVVDLSFLLLDDKNNVIGPSDISLRIDLSQNKGKNANFILRAAHLTFDKAGKYKFLVKANEEYLGEYNFQVEKKVLE